ncbi:CD1871A family CXXC motif-containing protein [Desulfurivibrio dismutans]|uniref:CD1871A family CXXC motif-containing protein n=1 Tax=Desulfurivibrio dismutans TaxID=1398908 RepID=UPI0023DB2763|nr:CD1871A family CXXC motif-containing protein [Desulfurivibrio alkaliphilus]MDF1615395.1 CD1871A family CXXC motif-containing protein [Desulfurivibrio alkaliphilus]
MPPQVSRKPSRSSKTKVEVRRTPFVVILVFTLLGIIGIATGEPRRVLEQAVQVCLSCIGVG